MTEAGKTRRAARMKKRVKILVLSVSAGAGHVRAAQALVAAATEHYPRADVQHVDVMELVPGLFKKAYTESYVKVVEEHPEVWGYLYDRYDQEPPDSPTNRLRMLVERLNTRRLTRLLDESCPDHVICTHFLPAQILSRRIGKGKFQSPVWVQVTDYDVHSLWLHEHMSGYFAANEEVGWRIACRGPGGVNVHVTGIPIMPAFGKPQSRKACAAEFGLDPGKKTILMMSGGAGVGGLGRLAEAMLETDGEFQVIALAGKNGALLERLTVLADSSPGRLYPMGFTDEIERLMAASDLAVTKPGGLTTSECLAVGLPMIVVSPIPGQEERNSDFLLENGAALKASDPASLVYRVRMLMDNPAKLDTLMRNALALGRPNAARDVLGIVLKDLGA